MLACCVRNASILRPKCQHLQTNCLQLQEKWAVLGPSNDVVCLQNVQFEVVNVVVSGVKLFPPRCWVKMPSWCGLILAI